MMLRRVIQLVLSLCLGMSVDMVMSSDCDTLSFSIYKTMYHPEIQGTYKLQEAVCDGKSAYGQEGGQYMIYNSVRSGSNSVRAWVIGESFCSDKDLKAAVDGSDVKDLITGTWHEYANGQWYPNPSMRIEVTCTENDDDNYDGLSDCVIVGIVTCVVCVACVVGVIIMVIVRKLRVCQNATMHQRSELDQTRDDNIGHSGKNKQPDKTGHVKENQQYQQKKTNPPRKNDLPDKKGHARESQQLQQVNTNPPV